MGKPSTVFGIFAGVGLVAAGVGLGALTVSARRLRISAQSQFARAVAVPLMFPADERGHDRLDAQIAMDRRFATGRPPAYLRRRFDLREDVVAGRVVYTLTPSKRRNDARILYLHGGAYVLKMSVLQWNMVARLSERTGATVIVPDYPTAPEHDWQEAHALAREVYLRLVDEAPAQKLALAGESAGAGLALALAQTLRDAGAALPSALVLLSPWLDVTCSDPDQVGLEARDRILSIDYLRRAGSLWAGELPPTDPRVSPLFGSLRGLPPMAVFAGSEDMLLPDARRLAEKGRVEGAAVTLFEYPHQYHAWMIWLPGFVPEAGRALDQAAAFLLVRM
jgi:acetyl esterase/lipase